VSILHKGVFTPTCLDSFAFTQALSALAENASAVARVGSKLPELVISSMKLCKSHQAGRCRLGTLCRNIHCCRSLKVQDEAAWSEAAIAVHLPPIAATNVAAAAAPQPPVQDSTDDFHLPAIAQLTPTPPPSSKGDAKLLQQQSWRHAPTCLVRFARRWHQHPAGSSSMDAATPHMISPVSVSGLERIASMLRVIEDRDDVRIGDGEDCDDVPHAPFGKPQTTPYARSHLFSVAVM